MSYGITDSILAISTPSGRSFRAIIRLSGKNVLDLLKSVFIPDDCGVVSFEKVFNSCRGNLCLEREKVRVPVYIYFMRSPNSYTKEDVVEIHTFGSPPLLEMLMEALLSSLKEDGGNENKIEVTKDIRIAEPGEFTKRAFLNGRISLAEAESVMHIIRSRTDSELLIAVSNLKGKLTGSMHSVQEELLDLCARTEAAIDFYDQDIELISSSEIKKELKRIKEKLCLIARNGRTPGISHYGVKTVLIGWPNAGKSSLFNRLLNRTRAIVTQVSGTTRDTLEADINLEGISFRIKDTAGITNGKDELESIIAQRAHDSMEDAQMVIFVLDGSVGLCSEQIRFFGSVATKNKIIVVNKADLKQNACYENLPSEMNSFPVVKTSIVTAQGLEILKKTMVSTVFESSIDISATDIVFTVRQKLVVSRAIQILEEISNQLHEEISHELIAIDLRRVVDVIGEITGEVLTDDILDIIFSGFCIGK
ncbi:MAG: tRNA uridine-5-carboxymethylaminomethyl(34) synthesis GTPase MnmE [Candidatus Brocadiaceae bacterium]|nr:tRNA uridine-5-carboxymethylaminomethyl(34) synthesis GTPase MnmE [Candidatus Brocadiaceae bacterium]